MTYIEPYIHKMVRSATAFGKWYHAISIYNRYGLYHDDILDEEYNADQAEAVRRLPPKLYDGRRFRQIRAHQLELTKMYLPKDQWITCEDPMNWYLEPYIKEVRAEWAEKDEWAKRHPQ